MSFFIGVIVGAVFGVFVLAVITAAGEETMVMHGKWERTEAYPHLLYCSVCDRMIIPNEDMVEVYDIPINYCPNCGAKMDLK